MTQRILITGAAGKIGRSVAPDRPSGSLSGPAAARRCASGCRRTREEVVTLDLNDRRATGAAMKDVDAVIHLAAIASEASFDDILAGTERPSGGRSLSTWLSPRDCLQPVRCCLDRLGRVARE